MDVCPRRGLTALAAEERNPNMFQFIGEFFSWIASLWSGLPDKTKEKIIDATVNLLGELLRAIFRHFTS